MYKDKTKQKEANRLAKQRSRQGMTKGMTLHDGPRINFDNGCFIHVAKLIDPKSRGLLTYLVENLKPNYQDSIRVGMSGPSISDCKKLLEVTA